MPTKEGQVMEWNQLIQEMTMNPFCQMLIQLIRILEADTEFETRSDLVNINFFPKSILLSDEMRRRGSLCIKKRAKLFKKIMK